MNRLSALPFLLTASLLAASCGSSSESAIEAQNDAASITEAPTDASGEPTDTSGESTDTSGEPSETTHPSVDDEANEAGATDDPSGNETTEATTAPTSPGFESSPLAEVMAAQSEIQSGRFILSAVISGDGQSGTIEISGRFNTAAGTSEITMDLADMASIIGERAGELAFMIDEPMIVRTIGDQAYVSGGIFSMFTGGTGWARVDADDADAFTDDFAAGLSADDMLADFEGQDVTMTEVGRETIDGVETTHYIVSIPDADIPDLDVWIDDNDLLVKLAATQADDDTFGPDSTFTMTMRYFDLGEPVEIVAPPEDEVIDGSQIAAMLGE